MLSGLMAVVFIVGDPRRGVLIVRAELDSCNAGIQRDLPRNAQRGPL